MPMRFLSGGLIALALGAAVTPAQCARNPTQGKLQAVSMEVLVFEVENCAYCQLFRRDVLPKYEKSKRAETAPIRFLNARKVDPGKLGLTTPLSIVPTVVIMQDGREQGRISGYAGPEPFFHMISQIIRRGN